MSSYDDPSYILIDPVKYRAEHPLNTDYQQNEGHPLPDPPRNRTENDFTKLGYEWLGPGTDVYWNMQHNVQPINELDRLGMIHDIAYTSIGEAFRYGELTYDQALQAIAAADKALEVGASKLPTESSPYWDPYITGGKGSSVSHAMGLKQEYDAYFGTPSWSGIKREDYNTWVRPSVADGRWDDDPYVDYGPGMVGPRPFDPVGRNPDYTGDSVQRNFGDSSEIYNVFAPPEASIASFSDRNRNGIPDVLEKKRKRRRHKKFPNFS